MSTQTESPLGPAYVRALSGKNFQELQELLDPEIDFLGLTPNRTWRASSARELVDEILTHWFDESDEIHEVVSVQTDSFADTNRVGYRFAGRNPDGPFEVEQQAYYREHEGRITWMRVVCSGFR
ncbi:MAG: hypothetical protein WAK93_03210 [Solirubrobacteraceae bacterium]